MPEHEEGLEELIKRSSALGLEGLEKDQEKLLRDALARFPDSPSIHRHLAGIVFQRDLEEAKLLLRRAVELAPSDPWNLTLCGSLMFDLDEKDEAKECALRAERLADDEFGGWSVLSHLMGRIASFKGQTELAEKALRFAFEEDPTTPGYGRELAALYYNTERFNEALETVDDALRHKPDDEALRNLRLEILEQIDESNE